MDAEIQDPANTYGFCSRCQVVRMHVVSRASLQRRETCVVCGNIAVTFPGIDKIVPDYAVKPRRGNRAVLTRYDARVYA